MTRFSTAFAKVFGSIRQVADFNAGEVFFLAPISQRARRRSQKGHNPYGQGEALEVRSLLSSTPLAHWGFDETSGTTVADSTSTGANGTNYGASPGIGAIGGGLLFDGVSDNVKLGTGASLDGPTDFTVTAWIRTTSTQYQTIIQQRDVDGFNGEYLFFVNDDGTLSFVIFGDGRNQFLIGTQQSVNDGAWHFVAAGREGTRGFIFIDGARATESFGPIRNLASTIGIGVGSDIRANDSFFEGSIDEVSVYASALPASEIASDANIIVPQGISRNPRPVFTWPKVANAASYSLWVDRVGATGNPVINATVDVNHFTATADLGIGQYRTWVRATLNDGTRTAWKLQTFAINGNVNVLPIDLQQTTYRPELQWEAFPGADHYDLWIDNLSTGQKQVVREQNLTGTSWTSLTDLPFGQYQVYIRAVDATGVATLWTHGPAFNIAVAPTPIGPASSTINQQPQFTWTAVSGAQGYDIVIRNSQTKKITNVVRNISGTSWTPSAKLSIGTYQWSIAAVGAANLRGNWSEQTQFSVGGITQISSVAGGTPTRPVISWSPVTDAARYWLWIDRVGVQNGYISQSTITSANFQPSTPLPVGTYRAWVRAISATPTFAPWSNVFEFTIS